MSLVQTINYDTPGNFIFDSTKIQFTGPLAELKLKNNPSQLFNQSFASSAGFTFDASRTEFVSGVMRQVDQRPANASFGATYTSSLDGNWGNGTLTGTALGTGHVSGGKLVCNGTGGVQYSAVGNAQIVSVGAIKMKVTPLTLSGTTILWAMSEAVNSTHNYMTLYRTGTGHLHLFVANAAGATLTDTDLGAWSPVSGQTYEIETNLDFTNGATRVFIDGIQFGSAITLVTAARSSSINIFNIGADETAPSTPGYFNGSFDDIEVFTTVQHTSNYTPGYSVPEFIYLTDTVVLPTFTYPGTGAIQSLDAFSTTDGNTPHYTVNGKYWNGSSWLASDESYAQSNSASVVNAQIGNLTASNTVVIRVIWDDSNLQMSVDDLTLTYTGQIYDTGNPTLVNTSGISASAILAFSETSSASGSDAIRYALVIQGQDTYWNGTAWVASDGSYAQANDAATVAAHVGTLSISQGVNVNIKAFLHSADGSTTPTLTQVVLTYNFEQPFPTLPNQCIVFNFLKDMIGAIGSVEKAVLVVSSTQEFKYGAFMIAPFQRIFAYDANGYVETTVLFLQKPDVSASDGVVETQSLGIHPYTFEIRYNVPGLKPVSIKTTAIQVPNQLSQNLVNLWSFPTIP